MNHIERSKHPTWGLVRYVLGVLQMTGALTAAALVTLSGVTPLAIVVASITTVFTVTSLILFRRS
jgi:hypothetical protein